MSNFTDYNKNFNSQSTDEPKEMFSGLAQVVSETEEVIEATEMETSQEPDEVTEQSVEPQVEVVTKTGVINNCDRLNVRESPSINSEIVCIIDKSKKVVIDEEESTDDFYKIYLSTGLEGFCLKEFIKFES